MFVENVQDVGFGQNVRKRKSLVVREAVRTASKLGMESLSS